MGDGAEISPSLLVMEGTEVITLSQAFNPVFIGLQSFSANHLTCRFPICSHPQSIWARRGVFLILSRSSVWCDDLCPRNGCGSFIAGRSSRGTVRFWRISLS